MPTHTHTQDAHSHGITDPGHAHTLRGPIWRESGGNVTLGSGGAGASVDQGLGTSATVTGISVNSTTATNQNTGGGGAHNNLQPYIVLNYIIKATSGVTAGDTALETRVGSLETTSNDPIKLNGQVISSNYSIPVGYNGLSAGPITIANGVTVTIPDGSAWSVV
jgi:hypothetical protein